MSAPRPSSSYNGRPSFANPKYLKKAQSEKPCLYEIPYDKDDLANIFSPDKEETLTLEQESRLKLHKEIIKPYDYRHQNSLYEIFRPPTREYLNQSLDLVNHHPMGVGLRDGLNSQEYGLTWTSFHFGGRRRIEWWWHLYGGDGGRRNETFLHMFHGWLGLSTQPTPREVDRVDKVKALGANGVMNGSRVEEFALEAMEYDDQDGEDYF
ncbi:hypothetical protein Tco_0269500 [Tanacetum coccineum]